MGELRSRGFFPDPQGLKRLQQKRQDNDISPNILKFLDSNLQRQIRENKNLGKPLTYQQISEISNLSALDYFVSESSAQRLFGEEQPIDKRYFRAIIEIFGLKHEDVLSPEDARRWNRNKNREDINPSFLVPDILGELHPRQKENIVSSEQDLQQIVKIARYLHPKHPQFSQLESVFSRWHEQNNKIFEFVTIASKEKPNISERIGYTCVIPLKENTYEVYITGKLSEWDIGRKPDDIIPTTSEASCQYLLIQSIELRSDRREVRHRRAIFSTLARHLANFNSNPSEVKPIICADGNKIGRKLLANRGFHQVADEELVTDGRPLFKLDFAERLLTDRALKTVNELTYSMTQYGKLNPSEPSFKT